MDALRRSAARSRIDDNSTLKHPVDPAAGPPCWRHDASSDRREHPATPVIERLRHPLRGAIAAGAAKMRRRRLAITVLAGEPRPSNLTAVDAVVGRRVTPSVIDGQHRESGQLSDARYIDAHDDCYLGVAPEGRRCYDVDYGRRRCDPRGRVCDGTTPPRNRTVHS